jgi:hypothetical protein
MFVVKTLVVMLIYIAGHALYDRFRHWNFALI